MSNYDSEIHPIKSVGSKQDLEYLFAERVDQLISLDVASRNVVHMLYPFARKKNKLPLAMTAARLLKEKVQAGDYVFIATGWPDRPHVTPEIAETDGPPGAAALARAIHFGLKAIPIILIEEHLVKPMEMVLEATGLRVVSSEEAMLAYQYHAPIHAAAVIGFPFDVENAKQKSVELLEGLKPSAVISIEKGGMNQKGEIHTSRGAETTKWMAKVDFLIEDAKMKNIVTIGIGDGGNEIGMGNIRKEIQANIPYGATCTCGCNGGIAPINEVDVLIAASISNWGAYGVAACLAFLSDDIDVFHNREIEERILRRSADARFIDGITGLVDPSADGLRWPIHAAFVDILREVTLQSLGSYRNLKNN